MMSNEQAGSDYDYDLGYKPRDDRRDQRIELLEERIQEIKQEAENEKTLREKYPSLQDAWEKYQSLRKLIGPK